jgi:hypothetical protein
VVVAIALPILFFLYLKWDTYNLDQMDMQLMEVYRAYAHYVKDHDGSLPSSSSLLVSEGYLVPDGRGSAGLIGPTPRQGAFIPVYHGLVLKDIDEFVFTAQGSVEDFEVRNGKLLREGKEQASPFIMPPRRALRNASMDYSRRIVEKWKTLEERKDVPANG